jgi:hypothetical protein
MKPETSERRIAANRANAQKSTGPKTPEGRARSSQNAYRHGLCATSFIVANENLDEYNALRRDFAARFGPCDYVEACLVDRMVRATWNMMRCWTIENEALNLEMERQLGIVECAYDDVQEHTRVTLAAEKKCTESAFRTYARYQAHQSLEFQRAYKLWIDLRKNVPIAPPGPIKPVVFEIFAERTQLAFAPRSEVLRE